MTSSTTSDNTLLHNNFNPNRSIFTMFNDNPFQLNTNTSNTPITKSTPLKKTYEVGDFIIDHKLGEGSFGKVFLATHKTTKEKAAVKILVKAQLTNSNTINAVQREIINHKKLHHESILRFYSVIETSQTIIMVNEYCSNGDLFNFLFKGNQTFKKIVEADACRLFFQLINGINYLHKQNIAHRDIKLDNLLLTEFNQLKIADFGFSTYASETTSLQTQCGSLCYTAPEIITGKKYNGASADLWSCGVVLYALVVGKLPFDSLDKATLIQQIVSGNYGTMPIIISKECKDLMNGLLTVNPSKRYTMNQIKRHPWFSRMLNDSIRTVVSPGVNIEADVIPFDKSILFEIKVDYGYDIDHIIKSVLTNSHNDITTAYYLQLMNWVKKGIKSVSDISSTSVLFMRYIEKDIARLKYFACDLNKVVDFYQREMKEDHKMYITNEDNDIAIFNDKKPMRVMGKPKEKIEIRRETDLKWKGLGNKKREEEPEEEGVMMERMGRRIPIEKKDGTIGKACPYSYSIQATTAKTKELPEENNDDKEKLIHQRGVRRIEPRFIVTQEPKPIIKPKKKEKEELKTKPIFEVGKNEELINIILDIPKKSLRPENKKDEKDKEKHKNDDPDYLKIYGPVDSSIKKDNDKDDYEYMWEKSQSMDSKCLEEMENQKDKEMASLDKEFRDNLLYSNASNGSSIQKDNNIENDEDMFEELCSDERLSLEKQSDKEEASLDDYSIEKKSRDEIPMIKEEESFIPSITPIKSIFTTSTILLPTTEVNLEELNLL